MTRGYRKNLLLLFLAVSIFAAYAFAFRYVRQTQKRLGITDEMIAKSRHDQAALCPSGFAPMTSSDSCFNLRGMVVPKLKQPATEGEAPASAQ